MEKSDRLKLKDTAELFIYAIKMGDELIKKSDELNEKVKNEEASDEKIEEVNKEIDKFAVFVEELLKRDNLDTLKKMIEIVREKMQ